MSSSGSTEYLPDNSAILSDVLYTALLAQRDAGLRVPINYVTAPGVALTAACFSDGHYEDGPAQKCLSNLLAIGFRRFVLDLYWDTSRLVWSLCPVELSDDGAAAQPSSANASTSLTTSSEATSAPATLTGGTLVAPSQNKRRDPETAPYLEGPDFPILEIRPRQIIGTSDLSTAGSTVPSTSDTTAATLSSSATPTTTSIGVNGVPTPVPNSGGTLYQVGPYTCDSSLGLSNITSVLEGHLRETENSLNATLKYLVLNLHSAALYNDPTGTPPTPEGSFLPATGNYLGGLLNTSLSSYIYTPFALQAQRANLNASWFVVDYNYRPLTSYLDLQTLSDGMLYTSDGWPSESYIELQRALRFLTGFGTVDAEMLGYNFTADADTIFPPGYMNNPVDVTLSSTGSITNGCIFDPDVTTLSKLNSSWAESSSTMDANDLDFAFLTANNLTACGISPILNATLGATANDNITLYIEYMQREIWSWALYQPQDDDSMGEKPHCAALNITNEGKWQVASCGNQHYGVCRIRNAPYEWTVTSQSGTYQKMDDACEDDNFSAPATGLENTYLRSAIQAWKTTHDDDDGSELFWVNFNDLDVSGCWVNGVNSSCPYVQNTSDPTRTVVVPVVAAVIIFVIAILTTFIKCAANRQNSRRRRRGVGGWDYEGVPS